MYLIDLIQIRRGHRVQSIREGLQLTSSQTCKNSEMSAKISYFWKVHTQEAKIERELSKSV